MQGFHASTQAWFAANFQAPTEVQSRGWEAIADGRHALLVAPTGSGKTLAAFLWAIDRLVAAPEDGPSAPGYRVLYVSPLKALAYDVERNLRAPAIGVQRAAEAAGITPRALDIHVRTGDTTREERARQLRQPGDILVTTPESLFLLLGSRAGANLQTVQTVIIDEIHALAPTKRGVHLALSLERLAERASHDPQRIGLSATVRPLDEVARYLGGARPIEIIDASRPPQLELEIHVPVPDMERPPPPPSNGHGPPEEGEGSILALGAREVAAPSTERGIWPSVYPALLADIARARSTILFVNSRGLCERLTQRLNELAGEELVWAHHGSVSHEKRREIEDALKSGRIRALVATSSMELGIDMGALDQVLLVESPGSVARGLQRVGRAGHQVGAKSFGRLYPKFRGDLLESVVIAERMRAGEIEALRVPQLALDVLAQQVVAMCCEQPRSVENILAISRRSHGYAQLSRDALASVLDMLSGRFPSSEFADLRPRLRWDRKQDVLSPRRGTELVSRMNAGTIPDRGTFGVHLGSDGARIGELDEEMVYETRDGDTFLLGASTWRVEEIGRDRVIVSPAPGEPGRLPFWRGAGPGRPLETGRALGAFVREVGAASAADREKRLGQEGGLSEFAQGNLLAYLEEQQTATGTLPTDRAITIERFRDELGDWRVCVLTPYGRAVHGPWAMALEESLSIESGIDVQLMYTDDGIVLRFADGDQELGSDRFLVDPEELEELVTQRLGRTAIFASLFRENAVRSLLVTRRRPDQRSPLWLQRIKTRSLFAVAQNYADFPVVLETYREALRDVFDMDGCRTILKAIQRREIAVDVVETPSPSPFARSLVFAYVANYLYDGDAPLAERKAQALTLDRNLLQELLGREELRELLDRVALEELEEELAGLAEGHQARDADELHDLLRRLGDLTMSEIQARCVDGGDPSWLPELEASGRAARISVAGEERWIPAEAAGLYRDALGCVPPPGVPSEFLMPTPEPPTPLAALLHAYARCHGPFPLSQVQGRFGLAAELVQRELHGLEQRGQLVSGEIRPAGVGIEWCDREVLQRLKRRTLARLRRQVAPVDASAWASFLPVWQGVEGERRAGLVEVIAQLEGLALPWSSWILDVLPARVQGFAPEALDLASARGEVVWVGRAPLGSKDGRVMIARREAIADWVSPVDEGAFSELAGRVLRLLAERGACFLTELERGLRGETPDLQTRELESALWELVWGGALTNDTFQPLLALGKSHARAWRGSLGGGRWARVDSLQSLEAEEAPEAHTQRTFARAQTLLERYGVVGREAALWEELPGGFSAIYRVLCAMEEAGRVRRGWFVEGLSGAQFALPGAVDRLRGVRARTAGGDPEQAVQLLAATDPANLYGALLPWPEVEGVRLRRVPGAYVALVAGRLRWYLAPNRRQLVLFVEEGTFPTRPDTLRALAKLPRRGRRSISIETINGLPVGESPHAELLKAAGFRRDYRGWIPPDEF